LVWFVCFGCSDIVDSLRFQNLVSVEKNWL